MLSHGDDEGALEDESEVYQHRLRSRDKNPGRSIGIVTMLGLQKMSAGRYVV
jgi:hypothetical protein